jgi:hypothetical protein
MFVVGNAKPVAQRIDCCVRRAPFALAQQACLLRINPRVLVLRVGAGNAVKRIVVLHRKSQEATVEEI